MDPAAPLVTLGNPSLVKFFDKVPLVNSGNKSEASCQSRSPPSHQCARCVCLGQIPSTGTPTSVNSLAGLLAHQSSPKTTGWVNNLVSISRISTTTAIKGGHGEAVQRGVAQ